MNFKKFNTYNHGNSCAKYLSWNLSVIFDGKKSFMEENM